MENKNIIFNYTLEQYNKKYTNRRHRLLKYTKKEVEEFDKKYGHYVYNGKDYNLEFNHYILKNRKWVLIGDTYYEVPKPIRFTWFRNLNAGVQIATCALLAGAVGGGTYGIYSAFASHNNPIAIVDSSLSEYIKIKSVGNDKDGNTVIHLNVLKQGFDEPEVLKGDHKLIVNTEYGYGETDPQTSTFEIIVFKATMNKYPGQIVIKVKGHREATKIDWATRKVDGTNTLYDLAKKSITIVIGTNATYKEIAEKLTDLVTYNVEEGDSPTGLIKAYYGKNTNNKYELYVLSDNKIAFEDNDRFGRDMSKPNPEEGYGFFQNCQKRNDMNGGIIDLENIDTSSVTDMSNLFYYCDYTKSLLNTSSLNTSNVTNMSGMFNMCENLSSLDVSKFDTSNVTNMRRMFSNCCSFETLDLSSFNTSKVTDMSNMFDSSYNINRKLKEIKGLNNFDTSNVTNMCLMFKTCENIEKLDVSHFNTSNVTNMYGMFFKCAKLSSLDVSKFDTSKVTTMVDMFRCLDNLTSLDISNFDTKNVVKMATMFQYSKFKTIYIDQTKFDTSKVLGQEGDSGNNMFDDCNNLKGEKGTAYNTYNKNNATYAKVDGGSENKGYFTEIVKLDDLQQGAYSKTITMFTTNRGRYRLNIADGQPIKKFYLSNSSNNKLELDSDWKVYINGNDSSTSFEYDSATNVIKSKNSVSISTPGTIVDFEVTLKTNPSSGGYAVADNLP